MLSVERFIRHEDKEYKLVLSLVYDNEKYNWLMLVFSRDISCKFSSDENFFEKNLGWQVVLEDFPKEAQKEFEYKENFEEAYTSLKNKLQADDMLLVTGSFYLVGAVLNYCKRGKDES